MADVKTVLKLDARDNVAIALKNLAAASRVGVNGIDVELVTDVPVKYKFAMRDLPAGEPVIMYGVMVGRASVPIRRGEVITVRNLRHEATPFREKTGEFQWRAPDVSRWRDTTFLGYQRSDGQVGTRNHWLVIPLVFCENRNILMMKQAFEEELGFAQPPAYRQQVAQLAQLYREGKIDQAQERAAALEQQKRTMPRSSLFKNIDGIQFLIHEAGCGSTREDANNLCGLLAGYLHHPNVAGATVFSLGCQHSQTAILREQIRQRDPNFSKPLIVFEQQQSASEFAMLSEAIRRTFLGLVDANKNKRAPAPLSKLVLGLKCGGSDGFSGISANPAIGHTADLLAALGGRGILSEFPELCGVEQDLINRSTSKEVSDRFVQLMEAYAARAKAVGSGFDMNPSPGNIRDGLITDAMKSAGAEKKGGTSPVTAVLDYPEYSSVAGLNLQCTPGNDVECVTAQVGAGASVVLFTTGLGTPTGNPIAPVVKVSTNSDLARRMGDIIDIDAGTVVSGEKTIEQMGETVLDVVVSVASGETHTKAEILGQRDFIPWKRGVSL
ncbi:MAG TPA: altronate dehydratase family protein [Candidatus Acidoferrales bacterium]|nr:altronate dehydratase family protein [Candidatus Acidoferrales bacterium]